MKKILSVVLALVLVCGLAVTAMAANVDMSTDKTVVEPGDTITLTVKLDEAVPASAGTTVVQLTISYDTEALSFTEGTAGEGYEYLVFVDRQDKTRVQMNSAYDFSVKDLPAGVICTVTFTAKETVAVEDLTFVLAGYVVDALNNDTASVEGDIEVTVCPDHNVVETVVEGSCTVEGSTTKACETCGYTETIEEGYNTDNHGEIIHVEAKEASCFEEGNIEYWYCADCGATWTDEALTQVSNQMSVKIAPTHDVKHVEAVAPSCEAEGNIEYWYCTICGSAWLDEYCWYPTNLLAVVLPATHNNIVHIEAVEPGCHYEGNVEYWYCSDCDTVWVDEDLLQISNHKNVILPALGGDVIHVEAKEPTCFEEGNIEYWYCEQCEQVWQDEALTQLTNMKNVILAVSHNIEHVEANECTCWEDGNIEYWYCTICGYAWLDEYQHLNTNLMSVVLPYTGHTIEHVAAKAPTCTTNGNVEYWYCTCCGYAWVDEDCTMVSNLLSVVLPATGHVDENKDDICDVCGGNAKTGDISIVVAAAAAVISMTGAVALPIAKKKFF